MFTGGHRITLDMLDIIQLLSRKKSTYEHKWLTSVKNENFLDARCFNHEPDLYCLTVYVNCYFLYC